MKKILLVLLGLIVLGAGATAFKVSSTWDKEWDVPIPNIKASEDPAVIARGEYLVYGPAHCGTCHLGNLEDMGKLIEKPPLSGGIEFVLGPLGKVYSSNLTSDKETGIGRYSDGQIVRLMRHNVKPNGRASIGPMMPFGELAEDDMLAIISYLRASKPVKNAVPPPEWTAIGKIVRTFASTFQPRFDVNPAKTAPPEGLTKERGEYLARSVTNCAGCHTPRDLTTYEATGPDFSGGFEMEPLPVPGHDPKIWYRTPNLTPAPDSALSRFPTREVFVARLKLGGRQHRASAMQWESFAATKEEDLGAIYEFLKSLPPSPGPTGEVTFKKEN